MEPPAKATYLVLAVALHGLLLMRVMSGQRRSRRRPVFRFFLWALSVAYFPLMSHVLSYMTNNLWSMDDDDQTWLLLSVVLVQLLKAKTDIATLAIAAITSPPAGGDDVNSQKVRPSMESFIYSFWVAGLVIYPILSLDIGDSQRDALEGISQMISPLWEFSTFRMLLRFVAFQRATGSFALGRNVQLMDGCMLQLHETGSLGAEGPEDEVPRLIVTGERNKDVDRSPLGYRVKRSALEDGNHLVTLDPVWSQSDSALMAQGSRISASPSLCSSACAGNLPGTSWAFRFVHDGLLGREDDHERIFRVIACELTFASDFYYSPLPVASLGNLFAVLDFFLSLLILVSLGILFLIIFIILGLKGIVDPMISGSNLKRYHNDILQSLAILLPLVIGWTEIMEILVSLRSTWTKLSIIGHYIRCQHCCIRKIFSCLLRWRSPKRWKDEMGQADLLRKPRLLSEMSWVQFFKHLLVPWRKRHKPVIKVSPEVKAAILRSFRSSGGQLRNGMVTVQRRCQAFCQDITWACHGHGPMATR